MIHATKPLRRLTRTERPHARLFCFPYAGAGGSAFHPWTRLMPPHVELVAATYPGREARVDDLLPTSLEAVIDELWRHMSDFLDLPYALFGHSMGALVAFELGRRLAPLRMPEQVIVSGARAPHCPRADELHRLPPREFLKTLVALGGFPPEALGSSELIAYALPVLRADFTACERHVSDLGACARFPLMAVGGDADPLVAVVHVDAWRAMSSVGFASRIYAGDHFFLREHVPSLVMDATAALSPEGARPSVQP